MAAPSPRRSNRLTQPAEGNGVFSPRTAPKPPNGTDASPGSASAAGSNLLDWILLHRKIPPQDLANLKNYKYAAVDYSLVSKYLLKPYWNWLLGYMPMWLAPNMITLIGLMFVLVNCGLVAIFDGALDGIGPPWLYFSLGFGLFAYQSMDNIDGGQARRTGSSSPMGELFDHGCDALNATFGTILQASSMGLGFTWRTLLLVLLTTVPFYFSTAEEFHTHMMYFGMINGPVEGVLIGSILMVVSGITGAQWWHTPISSFVSSSFIPEWLQLTDLILFPMLGMMLFFHVPLCLINLYRALPAQIKASGSAAKVMLKDHLPLILFHLACAGWVLGPYSGMLDVDGRRGDGLLVWFISVGLDFGRLCTEIIECYLTQMPFPFWRMTRLSFPFFVGAVGAWLIPSFREELEMPYLILLAVWSTAMYLRWATGTIQDFKEELGIYCLRIPGPGKEKT